MKTKTNTLIIASLLIVSLHAQDKPADPYRASGTTAEKATEEDVTVEIAPNISICYEAFSLPLAMAAELQREQLADSALYAKMVAGLGDESVRQEIIQVLRARSGQKATTKSISEQIYATDAAPPGIATIVAGAPDATHGAVMASDARTPATPTAFETRNVGLMLEIAPTLSQDEKFVDLRLFPELVTLVGRTTWGQEFSAVEMPEFETNSLDTSATVRINQPFLLGTNSPPPVSKVDPDSANRVWFAFVTATLSKP